MLSTTQSGRELPCFSSDYGRSQQQSPKTFEDGIALRSILPSHPQLEDHLALPPRYAFNPIPSPFEQFYGRQIYVQQQQQRQGETFNSPFSEEESPLSFFGPSSSPPPPPPHRNTSYSSTSSATYRSSVSPEISKSFPSSDEQFIHQYLDEPSPLSSPPTSYPNNFDDDSYSTFSTPYSSLLYSLPSKQQDQSFGLLQQPVPPPLWQQEEEQSRVDPSSSTFPSSALPNQDFYPGQGQGMFGAERSSQVVASEGKKVDRRRSSREESERSRHGSGSAQVDDSQPNEDLLGEQTAFISKVWHLLHHSEYSKYLLWSTDGKSFVLIHPEEFSKEVLPRFFRHQKVTSFVRQLNLYSFNRVPVVHFLDTSDPSMTLQSTAPGFSHQYFQRGKPEELRRLHPRPPTTTKKTLASRRAAAAARSEESRRIKFAGAGYARS
ncbi:HSF-type DNA-binding-domain-containing protein [Mrakia frigida]|uniref:heat shock factor family protein n=1 Tax=Mrakia frigida TaxID=29902 RepID=UPI003FCC234C